MARSNFLKALALLSLTLCVASAEFEFIFKTTVDGESNIPVLTDAQTGGAKAYFDVIWEGDYFTWYMEVEGIQNMTMAHIHMVRGRQRRQGFWALTDTCAAPRGRLHLPTPRTNSDPLHILPIHRVTAPPMAPPSFPSSPLTRRCRSLPTAAWPCTTTPSPGASPTPVTLRPPTSWRPSTARRRRTSSSSWRWARHT